AHPRRGALPAARRLRDGVAPGAARGSTLAPLGAAAGRRRISPRCRAARRAAQRPRQPALLRRARQALLRAGDRRRLPRARRGLLVRPDVPRRQHLQRRALRHVRDDCRPQDAAAPDLCARHQPPQRPQRRRAHQRSRRLRRPRLTAAALELRSASVIRPALTAALVLAALVLAALAPAAATPAAAAAPAQAAIPIPRAPAVNARSYILLDHFSGRVLADYHADERAEPASL